MDFADRLEILCDTGPFPEAGSLKCAAIAVGGRYTREAVRAYAESDVQVSTLIDWPVGLGKPTVRQIEAVAAGKDGAHGIELMAHPGHILHQQLDALRDDLMGVVIAAREVSREIAVHVTADAAWFDREPARVQAFCLAVRESGGDGVTLAGADGVEPAWFREAAATMGGCGKPLVVKAQLPAALIDQAPQVLDLGLDRVCVSSENLGILSG